MERNALAPASARRPRVGRGSYQTDEQRWNALVRRDRNADGMFFYSVKTTGVYCRPSCASRLPRRENVRFHSSCEAAEKAGFRPCKRCQPNGPALAELHATTVTKACRIIADAEEPPSLKSLAKSIGMSPFHFHRVFTKIVGVTPKAYSTAQQTERLRKLIPQRSTVTEAIYEAGYKSSSRFYEKSSEMLGMSPQRFRMGGTGMTIRFAIGECSLGSILIASSDKGVCAVLLGDDPNALAQDLQDRFPRANLIGSDHGYEEVIATVIGHVENPHLGLNLPLDVRGTAFQKKVWLALRAIPPGHTATYSEIAHRIALPKAIRAVASACAANAIAVAIPCHRVLRRDGSLSGYRWGVDRKRALLLKEKKELLK